MNYYKVILTDDNIDKFLYICSTLGFVVTAICCRSFEYIAIYKGTCKIDNIDELYSDITMIEVD